MDIDNIPNFQPPYSFDVSANDAINLKLIRSVRDFDNEDLVIKPSFTHQIFGQDERILGYHELRIDIFYIATTLDVFLSVNFKRKASPLHTPITTTPIQYLTEVALEWESNEKFQYKPINHQYFSEKTEFLNILKSPQHINFRPPGKLVHEYMFKDREFVVYRGNISDPSVRDYHIRFQTFLLFFIETTSYIDDSDELWDILFLFERVNNRCHIVGYASLYPFYAYPDKIRNRISQFLVLPPFQRQGHGGVLLETIYRECLETKGVVEVTVEEPSPGMSFLMDRTDFRIFHSIMEKQQQEEESSCGDDENFAYRLKFTKEMWSRLRSMTMIPKPQLLKCYEMYKLLKILEKKDKEVLYRKEMKRFRLEVKRRLFQVFDLRRVVLDEEIRKEKLNDVWLEVTCNYRKILKKYILSPPSDPSDPPPQKQQEQQKMKDEDDEEEVEGENEEEQNRLLSENGSRFSKDSMMDE